MKVRKNQITAPYLFTSRTVPRGMAARRSLTWLFEAINARMRRAAPMTAKSKEKKRAMRVRRAIVVGVPVGELTGAPSMCATLMYVGGWKYQKRAA